MKQSSLKIRRKSKTNGRKEDIYHSNHHEKVGSGRGLFLAGYMISD